ncbi:diguanylate cyclase domain-containing protein [Inhella gelatinilytica]|uniref:diguanylate cyclase n=1 Tax=Inhella gelatinilytica TaxID=2795030 RepID=A0A931NCJ8_9BURK|nr:diguanylate cyclase [Inhella gelatinilytica]MBH9552092.1 diguanylate cyclase [Inhella gelatinilytica]
MTHRPSLLLVDDEPDALHVLAHCLEGLGTLHVATSGTQALAMARRHPPSVVLLDANMPGLSGFETCQAFKADPLLAACPILFVTAEDSAEQEAKSFEIGAVDYITKPIHPVVVRARVRTQLRLKELTDELRRLALEDPLTGLASRRCFEPQLVREVALAARSGLPIAVMMVDIDHFKRFNDSAGHAAGDHALREVAQALSRAARRPGDLICRLGGEEFAFLLPQTGLGDASTVADRALEEVRRMALPHPGLPEGQCLSVSLGLAAWSPGGPVRDAPSGALLLEAADRALYAAKQGGRNTAYAVQFGPEPFQTRPLHPGSATVSVAP